MRILKNGGIKFSNRDIMRLKKETGIRNTNILLKSFSKGLYSSSEVVSNFFIRYLFKIVYPKYPRKT